MLQPEQIIHHFIVRNFLFTDDLTKIERTDSLLDRGVMDSTGVLELVSYLEKEFGLSVSDAELVPDNLDSVAHITEFVEHKLGPK